MANITTTSPGTEPIGDDELLYRQIPVSLNLYDPILRPHLLPDAFRPNANDITGLSVYRAKYKSIEQAAQGRSGKQYYVAVLRAGDLRSKGIEISARPLEEDPGHAEIPGLTYQNRHDDRALEWKVLLSQELCLRVEGPFTSPYSDFGIRKQNEPPSPEGGPSKIWDRGLAEAG